MASGNPRELATPKHFVSAFAPFPRSTWIHPHVPHDNFDRVCKIIRGREYEAKEEHGGGHSSPERQVNEDCRAPGNKPSHRAEEQQKEPDDLGRSAQYEEYERQYQTAYTRPAITLPNFTRPAITLPNFTRPAITLPNFTLPAITLPNFTLPAITLPNFTRPAITLPNFTLPAITLPNFTLPAITLPNFTRPAITLPNFTLPAITLPNFTLPAITLPAITHPAITLPNFTLPAITHPAITHPAITLPAITHPAITLPAFTHPAITLPAITLPAITHPAITLPAFTHPAITHPAITLPAFTHPAITHPAITLPCPYLSVHRSPYVAKPARELNPVMKQNVEAKGNNNLSRQEEDVGDQQSSVANYAKRIGVPQSSRRGDNQSSAPEPQPLATNPICFGEDPQPATCESDNENVSSIRCNSSDDGDDCVPLPRVRSRGTDNSDGDSESKNNAGDEEENEIPHPFDELSSGRVQDSPSYTENFPALPTIRAGIPPCPTEPLASGKMHSQWKIPLSFYPHDMPTATLARGMTAHAQAPVQGKAEAPEANSQNNTPPLPPPPPAAAAAAAPTQQEAPDLLADFPALQPPKKPLLLGVWRDWNHKTKGAKGKRGHSHSRNKCQESGASHQRRMENVPHDVSSIYAGGQKSVLNLQTFGRGIPPTISCGELKANNQPPPRVAGTDGLDANARTWADAAKAGMKQAAAPQEKARPRTLQQTATINKAKAFWSPG